MMTDWSGSWHQKRLDGTLVPTCLRKVNTKRKGRRRRRGNEQGRHELESRRRRRLRSAGRTKGGCWNWALLRRIGTLAEIRSRFVFYSLPTLDVRELTIMPQ